MWWLDDDNGYVWTFTADGYVDQSNNVQEVFTLAENLEPYTIEEGKIVLGGDHIRCPAAVDLSAEGRMTLTPVDTETACGAFSDGTTWSFVRVPRCLLRVAHRPRGRPSYLAHRHARRR
jgi:hypothetical protein